LAGHPASVPDPAAWHAGRVLKQQSGYGAHRLQVLTSAEIA
jgi:hypothetical protein